MAMRLVAIMALPCALAGCGVPPDYFVVNEANREVEVLRDSGSMWADARALSPGGRLRLNVHAGFLARADGCTYTYPALASLPAGGVAGDVLSANPLLEFHVRPDFSLGVFAASEIGRPLTEQTGPGFPVQPKVDCRSKG